MRTITEEDSETVKGGITQKDPVKNEASGTLSGVFFRRPHREHSSICGGGHGIVDALPRACFQKRLALECTFQ